MKYIQDNSRIRSIMKLLLRGIRHIVLHNGWFKLIAILISVILWAGLISQDPNLTRDKTLQNVSVKVTGNESGRRGYVVKQNSNDFIVIDDLNEMLSNVSAVAAVPQQQYDEANPANYSLTLDLKGVTKTGEQELKIQSNTNSSRYGQIVSINPSTIKVNVEKYIRRSPIAVTVNVIGEVPDGWYIPRTVKEGLSVDPLQLTVFGPESVVMSISRAFVDVDLSSIDWKEGSVLMTSEIKLYNKSQEQIDDSQLMIALKDNNDITIDSVLVEATILPTRTYFLQDEIQLIGEPAEGYSARARVSPESVKIAARNEVLEQLDELPIEPINVSGLTESVTTQVKIQRPSEDAVLSNDTVTIVVEIIPVTDEE